MASQGLRGDFSPVDFSRRHSVDIAPVVADRAFVVQVEPTVVGKLLHERSIPFSDWGLDGKAEE